jgi:hypothetical protein
MLPECGRGYATIWLPRPPTIREGDPDRRHRTRDVGYRCNLHWCDAGSVLRRQQILEVAGHSNSLIGSPGPGTQNQALELEAKSNGDICWSVMRIIISLCAKIHSCLSKDLSSSIHNIASTVVVPIMHGWGPDPFTLLAARYCHS